MDLGSEDAMRLTYQRAQSADVRPIDHTIAARLASELDPDFGILWPDPAEFVARSFGFCVLDGVRPISYAVSGFEPCGVVCVGVATAEAYRGRGLCTRCLAALVQRCGAQGLDMEFCTGAANAPAIAVARKAGFTDARRHSWIGLRRPRP